MLTYTRSWPVFDLSFQRRPQQTGSDEAMTSRPENQPRAPLSDATAGMCTTGHLLASHTAPKGVVQCLLQAFLGEGEFRRGEPTVLPPTAAKLCALNLFLTMNYKYVTETFF